LRSEHIFVHRPDMRVIAADEHHAMGTYENFVVFLWRGRTHAAGMRGGANALAELIAAHPDGVAIMHVVEPRSVPPDSATRDILFELINRSTPPLLGTSVIAEGGGFRGAFVRSIVTGMTIITRLASPIRVFGTIDDAIDWHLELSESDSRRGRTRPDLAAFIEKLRAKIDEVGR
jgi:hypothetical protein